MGRVGENSEIKMEWNGISTVVNSTDKIVSSV